MTNEEWLKTFLNGLEKGMPWQSSLNGHSFIIIPDKFFIGKKGVYVNMPNSDEFTITISDK